MTGLGDEEKDYGGADKHDDIHELEAFWCDGTKESDWETENDTNIEDVATNNVADEELGFALPGGLDSSDEFWK